MTTAAPPDARPAKLKVLRWLPNAWVTTFAPRRGRGGQPALYLSFDDGPHPEHTDRVLDLLARHGAVATFFLVGDQVERHPAIVQRMVDGGHALGNHSYSHPRFETLSLVEQIAEIDRTDALLAGFDGRHRHYFRPPRGVLPWRMLLYFVARGRRVAYWSYDSLDYGRGEATGLLQAMQRNPPRPGEIILMHDDSSLSLQVLEVLLPQWRRSGYALEAMPDAP